MKAAFMIASLAAALLAAPAFAQPGPGADGMDQGKHGPIDCSTVKDPAACKAHQAARSKAAEACKDKAGPERKQCLRGQMQNMDCGKSRNPQQCEARKQAYATCKSSTGPAFKRCVQDKMPPMDCSKSADVHRCELHQKARKACKDKLGAEHRQCLRDQLAPGKQ